MLHVPHSSARADLTGLPCSRYNPIINDEGKNPLVLDNISNDNISKFSELLKESLEKSKTKMNDKQLKKIFDL
jgi:hypothetical protein